jgi:hypothetical protein
MADARIKVVKQAEAARPTVTAPAKSFAEGRLKHLASIGLTVGARYKTVWHGPSYLGSVELKHIVIDDNDRRSALVFQQDGVKDAPFQVVLLDKLTAFTIA